MSPTCSQARQLFRSWTLAFLQPRPLVGILYLLRYLKDWSRFKALAPDVNLSWVDTYPCLSDWVQSTPFDPHYFFQGAWLARRLAACAPTIHVDIGSSALMVSVTSAQCPTVFLDYRPLNVRLSGLASVAGDIRSLPFVDSTVTSLSCLHVIEHIGLGRYGDDLDPKGSSNAARELQRILASRGKLYLSVPVGRERVCFNAHRVFSTSTVLAWFPALELTNFSLVGDDGKLLMDVSPTAADSMEYGCGMFEFTRS